MIIRHNSCPEGKGKDNLRNEIYEDILPYMKKWMSSILSKKKIFLPPTDILSLSWDCFSFCLKTFKPDEKTIALPNHFHAYTKFCLISYLSKKRKNEKIEDEFSSVYEMTQTHLNSFYENMEELKKFKSLIPEDYKEIFDDAMLSMAGQSRDKIAYKKSKDYGYYKYCESKKVFKIVIDFLLLK